MHYQMSPSLNSGSGSGLLLPPLQHDYFVGQAHLKGEPITAHDRTEQIPTGS